MEQATGAPEERPSAGAEEDESSAEREPPVEDELESIGGKRRWWPLVVITLAVVAAAGTFVVFVERQLNPSKVLVAVDLDGYWWEGSKASAVVTDRFSERLSAMGFEPVKSGDPQVTATLEQADSVQVAARQLGAAFVVFAVLKPELIEHPITPPYYEGRVEGELLLAYAGEEPQKLGIVDGWSGARERGRAKELLGKAIADKVFDVGMRGLMSHPEIERVLKDGSAVDRGMLTMATRFLQLRDASMSEAKQRYEQLLEKRKAGESGAHDVTYHTTMEADLALGAVTPSGLLIQQTKILPFYDPAHERLGYYRDLDAVFFSDPNGERTPITSAYNLYAYPAASRDGKTVVFVEDIFGWAKAINVWRNGEVPKRLRVDPDHRYSSPAVSPNGAHAAYYDKPCRKCLAGLLVVDLKDGKTAFQRQEKQGELSGFTWIGEDSLLVVWRPVPTADQEGLTPQGIYQLDLGSEKQQLSLLLEVPEGSSLSTAQSDASGSRVVFQRRSDDGRALALLDVEANELEALDVGGGLDYPVLAPDGKSVAFTQRGEIVHYVLDSGKKTRLTQNGVRDRYPLFSPDGSRLYFETLADDPNFPKRRNVSAVASVKVP